MTKRRALTEAERRSTQSTYALLRDLQQHRGAARTAGGRRRLRLFACACCRQFWHLYADADSRRAVEVAERFADGRASRGELEAARRAAEAAEQRAMTRVMEVHGGRASWEGTPPPAVVAIQQARGTAAAAAAAAGELARAAEAASLQCRLAAGAGEQRWEDGRPVQHAIEAMQCALLRDLFGPLHFRPAALDPAWLAWNDDTVVRLARVIYDERAFDRLPLLADALEEAGCTSGELLDHLRGPGPHALGCHVLDAVIGKS